MTRFVLSFLTFLLLLFAYSPAMAQEEADFPLESCGTALETNIPNKSDVKFCDLYTRKLAYRENRIKYRQQIEERRKHYIRPSIEAKRKYDRDLQALYSSEAAAENAMAEEDAAE